MLRMMSQKEEKLGWVWKIGEFANCHAIDVNFFRPTIYVELGDVYRIFCIMAEFGHLIHSVAKLPSKPVLVGFWKV